MASWIKHGKTEKTRGIKRKNLVHDRTQKRKGTEEKRILAKNIENRKNIFLDARIVLETTSVAFCGYEKDRRTLKYGCLVAAYGLSYPLKDMGRCGGRGVGAYGRIVRAPLDKDRRIFVPIVRDSPKWKRLYKKRTSVERVNRRLDCSFGFERYYTYIRGLKKMRLQISLLLIVMLSMALSIVKEEGERNSRSLVAPFRLNKAA